MNFYSGDHEEPSDMMPCSLTEFYWQSGGTYGLQLRLRVRPESKKQVESRVNYVCCSLGLLLGTEDGGSAFP
jgi:hypothetical protein